MSRYRLASNDPKAQAFLDALIKVYKAHGMSLGHEDHEGAFYVHDYEEGNVDWLREAYDARKGAA